jgi:hypothetical protein
VGIWPVEHARLQINDVGMPPPGGHFIGQDVPSRFHLLERIPMPNARLALLVAAVVTAEAGAAACSKSESRFTATAASSGPAVARGDQSSTSGGGCTAASPGYPRVNLLTAKIGFSQSEKEANPFRIAETQSIKDQAAAIGIAASHLVTANAQSDLNKRPQATHRVGPPTTKPAPRQS